MDWVKLSSRYYLDPAVASLDDAAPYVRHQLERHGYFVTDRHDHAPGRPVLNRIAPLRDTWTSK